MSEKNGLIPITRTLDELENIPIGDLMAYLLARSTERDLKAVEAKIEEYERSIVALKQLKTVMAAQLGMASERKKPGPKPKQEEPKPEVDAVKQPGKVYEPKVIEARPEPEVDAVKQPGKVYEPKVIEARPEPEPEVRPEPEPKTREVVQPVGRRFCFDDNGHRVGKADKKDRSEEYKKDGPDPSTWTQTMRSYRVRVAQLLIKNGPMMPIDISKRCIIPQGSMGGVLRCEWFTRSDQGVHVTPTCRQYCDA